MLDGIIEIKQCKISQRGVERHNYFGCALYCSPQNLTKPQKIELLATFKCFLCLKWRLVNVSGSLNLLKTRTSTQPASEYK